MKHFVLLFFSAALPLMAAKLDETLATVNGEAIYMSEFEHNAENVLRDLRKATPEEMTKDQKEELRKKVLEQMVDDMLLLQEARRLKVKVYEKDSQAGVDEIRNRFRRDDDGELLSKRDAEASFQREIKRQGLTYEDFHKRIEKQLLVIKLVDQQIKAKLTPPTRKVTRTFFDKLKLEMKSTPSKVDKSTTAAIGQDKEKEEVRKLAQLMKDRTAERVRARHILIKVAKDAGMAVKSKALAKTNRLKKQTGINGKDFADLAEEHSQDISSAKRGGDLGYFIRGWMVPAFEKAAFSASVGKVVGPVETEFGYHLILVEEKRAASSLRLQDVENDLSAYLMQREFQTKLKDYVKGLRKKSAVKIHANRIESNKNEKKEGKP